MAGKEGLLMQIYELINKLTLIAKERGDLPVMIASPWGYIEVESNMIEVIGGNASTTTSGGTFNSTKLIISTNKT